MLNQDQWSPEKIKQINDTEAKNLEDGKLYLAQQTANFGFEETDMDGLNLSDDELKKINWVGKSELMGDNINYHFFKTMRKDGVEVKIIARVFGRTSGPIFAVDIFSPAFYNGHGGNNDFSKSELAENIKLAMELEPYPA